jgi:guanylate kinase
VRGILLYGPPAAGKDSVTRSLHKVDDNYRIFRRLKVGGGRTEGYRISTPGEVESLRSRGDIVWENSRYGASYYIDRGYLLDQLGRFVSVVHLGQIQAVTAVRAAAPAATWLSVYLWCPREVAEERIKARNTGDDEERLRAWDATDPLLDADLKVDTADVSIEDAARLIDKLSKGAKAK